jgi:hypothetical protein
MYGSSFKNSYILWHTTVDIYTYFLCENSSSIFAAYFDNKKTNLVVCAVE